MDSNDTGPPPKKRFMNGNREGQARTSESKDSLDFRRGHPGRGSRGARFSRGRGGFRGGFRGRGVAADGGSPPSFRPRDETSSFRGRGSSPFRGRGSSPFRGRGRSTSFSSPEDQSPGFRGGRGSFRSRGSSPGFRGRGGAPGFRGRGTFRGRRGAPGFRGRGGAPFSPGSEFSQDFGTRHVITFYNLPDSKNFVEQRDFVRGLLGEYNCMNVDVVKQEGQFSKAKCRVKDENSAKKACQDLNGRFLQDSQILVAGTNKHDPRNKPIVITNLSKLATLKDLVTILSDCKSIAQISEINIEASPPYIFVHVSNDDDVDLIMGKSSTMIKDSKIDIKCLDPTLVARSTNSLSLKQWEKFLGTDATYYINKKQQFTDIYFESARDLDEALRKVAASKKEGKEKVDLNRRTNAFFAEVCDVEGDVDDVELYSMMRKHGEISEFKRLDKDFYMVKQDLSAGIAAMSLSDSKGCGGVLKFSWLNTRATKEPEVKEEKKKKKKKKKKSVDKQEAEKKGSEETEDKEDQLDDLIDDEAMAEDDDDGEDDAEYDDVDEEQEDVEEDEEDSTEEDVVDSLAQVAATNKELTKKTDESIETQDRKDDKPSPKQSKNAARKRKQLKRKMSSL